MSGAEPVDLLVVGAGPCGVAVGVAAAQAGLSCRLLDRRRALSTIERYPLNMRFFSTPERLELAGVPFLTAETKPTRTEALAYYRRIVDRFALDVRQGEAVTAIVRRADGDYAVEARAAGDESRTHVGRAVAVATGYFDWPNLVGVPGEALPHVHHYFTEGHAYWRQDVVVVGAGNSAIDAALECWRAGARVTLVHLGDGVDATVKPWVLPDFHNRVREGAIAARWRTRVTAITPTAVQVEGPHGDLGWLPADAVLLMTGFRADTGLLAAAGVTVDPKTGIPHHDDGTMETDVPGLYLAGVIASGYDANRLFIENGREHGPRLVAHLAAHLRARGSARTPGSGA